MSANDVELQMKRLKNLLKFMVKGLPKVKVGILENTNPRSTDGPSNAEIGFVNEFGKMTGGVRIPPRSFLRMPLNLFFNDKMKEKKSLSAEEFQKAIESGNGEKFMAKVGMVAEEVIQEAFATNGYGKWEPNAKMTVELKGSDSPLIDTGQLRRAITSKVIKE